ncbi:hypothetical protein MATL_G00024900 [Megalops atlanticus]|uniref:Uncharacterized protein n=1 Tax=Megalops atlanticus TaxID=7932 RepID=A0A9D3QDV3_MEGAT|nr:hypothetical protein MATL_G00024900 [Megalops atlanticus]
MWTSQQAEADVSAVSRALPRGFVKSVPELEALGQNRWSLVIRGADTRRRGKSCQREPHRANSFRLAVPTPDNSEIYTKYVYYRLLSNNPGYNAQCLSISLHCYPYWSLKLHHSLLD